MNKDCEGYKKLFVSVSRDIDEAHKRKERGFSNRDDKEFLDKLDWIIARAEHYAEKTGLKAEDILTSWEKDRSYWYMNYYQESNQPEIKGDNVRVFETVDDLLKNIINKEFRCPLCNGVSKNPYCCDTGIIVKKVKDSKDGPCNWSAGGLFGTLGKGVYIFVKEKLSGEEIFMPIAWEKQEAHNA